MQRIKRKPEVYKSRLRRAFKLARYVINYLREHGADKRFYALRNRFEAARQNFYSLLYSPELSDKERKSVLACSLGLQGMVEQMEAKLIDVRANSTLQFSGRDSQTMGVKNDKDNRDWTIQYNASLLP